MRGTNFWDVKKSNHPKWMGGAQSRMYDGDIRSFAVYPKPHKAIFGIYAVYTPYGTVVALPFRGCRFSAIV